MPKLLDGLPGQTAEALTSVLGEAARTLAASRGLQQTVESIVQVAVDTVPGAEHAGLSLVEGDGSVSTRAATDDVVRRCDAAQTELLEGPLLDAIWKHRSVIILDLPHDDRWPRFARRVADLGVRSMLTLQVSVADNSVRALTLVSASPTAWVAGPGQLGAAQVGMLLADQAGVALAGAQYAEHLNLALQTRDVIGQAKGMLMARYGISADEAFHVLTRRSQDSNVKIRHIAEWVVSSGQSDQPAPP